MSVGWFASLFPVTVPIGDGCVRRDAARAAQKSFDAGKYLANVPFERVLEWRRWTNSGSSCRARPAMMVSFLDFRKIPVAALWEADQFRHLRRQPVARRDQHVDQPARRTDHRHHLLPGQPDRA